MATKSAFICTSDLIKFKAYNIIIYEVKPENLNFKKIAELLNAGKTRAAVTAYNSSKTKEVKSGFVTRENDFFFKGQKLPDIFAEIYRNCVSNNAKASVLTKFFDNLASNPGVGISMEAFSRFLSKRRMPLTSRGTFLAYKRVDINFKDTYTHKFDNTPGKIVEMERKNVDSNQHNECSTGFHVCSYEYLNSYVDDNLIVVEINPCDVVAVPPGYNHSKMRVSKYKSLCTLTEFKKQLMRKEQDVLGSMPFFNFEANGVNW
jgi:predicted transcriptional regulator